MKQIKKLKYSTYFEHAVLILKVIPVQRFTHYEMLMAKRRSRGEHSAQKLDRSLENKREGAD